MSGRGTPRVQPQGGKPSFFQDISSPAQGAWGYVIENSNSQVLTDSYVVYTGDGSAFEFDIPYGATRVSVIGLYTPAEDNGRLGLQVRWFTGEGLAYALLVKGNSTVAPSADPEVVEVETYGAAVVSPIASVPVTTPNRYVIPFVVPPLASPTAPTELDGQISVRMRIYVREAGTVVSPGTFALERIVAESFGEAQPFTQR